MVTAFGSQLRTLQLDRPRRGRRWVFVPYDQLSDRIGPLAAVPPRDLGIVLVESRAKANRRPYHRQKLALVLANVRHFALEQARRGVLVHHVATDGDYATALAPLARELGPLVVQRPAERELRTELAPLLRDGALSEIPHEGWLTSADDFAAAGGPPWRMDAFYRRVRRRTGILMHAGKPVGGKFSFDAENRKPWRGDPPAPEPPRLPRDEIKEEVCDLVAREFASHPGALDRDRLPATLADVHRLRQFARERCLPLFGPFEDAMSTRSSGLFHTRLSPLLNLHRVLPRDLLDDALHGEAPLPSKEGYVRQLLGWREFVRHVHEATDGFRTIDHDPTPTAPDGHAAPDFLGAARDLPPAFWGEPSGLACLDDTVATVWREAYSHHITRLMVLGNVATLLDCSPRQLADWFWVAYADAYDWVVEPNVLAMATFATGELMTTKPYVAGAGYVNRMSDHCAGCAFDPRTNCPLTRLYWAFLARHEERLADNQRLAMPLRSLRKRSVAQREIDAATFEHVAATLQAGARVEPAAMLRACDARLSPPS